MNPADQLALCLLQAGDLQSDVEVVRLSDLQAVWSMAATRLQEVSDWAPIETAPHDGTPIWAYQRVNKRQVPMKWKQGAGYAMWVYDDEFLQDCLPDPEPPSHYRLLPEPPREGTP